MTNAKYAWDAYARLQKLSQNNRSVTPKERALDDAMNQLLAGDFPPNREDVDRVLSNAERRERRHAALERQFLQNKTASDPCAAAEARISLEKIRSHLGSSDWNILLSHAQGTSYKEIERRSGERSGNLRIKAMRARSHISQFL